MNLSFFAGLSFGLAISVVGLWYGQGMHSATLNEEFVETVVVLNNDECNEDSFDPDFCIEKKRVSKPVFKIGLFDGVLPISGVLFASSVGLIFLARRRDRAA
jgi:hypothetical protein